MNKTFTVLLALLFLPTLALAVDDLDVRVNLTMYYRYEDIVFTSNATAFNNATEPGIVNGTYVTLPGSNTTGFIGNGWSGSADFTYITMFDHEKGECGVARLSCSWSVWTQSTGPGFGRIFVKNGAYSSLLDNPGDNQAQIDFNTGMFLSTPVNQTPNEWNHIVWTYNGTHVATYLNGTLEIVEAFSTAITDNANNITLGNIVPGGTQPIEGLMDELMFWYNRAINQSVVTYLYNNGVGRIIGQGNVTNDPPNATVPTVSPTVPNENQDANWSTTYTDPEGVGGDVFFEHSVNGVNVFNETVVTTNGSTPTSTLSSGNYSSGQNVSVVVTPNDGTQDGTPQSNSVIIAADLAPSVTTPSVSPASPNSSQDVTWNTTYTDPEASPGNVLFEHTVNGTNIFNETVATTNGSTPTSTLGSGNYSAGATVGVTVTPNDGFQDGSSASNSVVISGPPAPPGPPSDPTSGVLTIVIFGLGIVIVVFVLGFLMTTLTGIQLTETAFGRKVLGLIIVVVAAAIIVGLLSLL